MKNRGGFTIIETLITLAVSTAMFVAVMLMFNGRQGRVEFSQGLRDIESHIQDVVNDVRNGYYPNPNQQCSKDVSTVKFTSSPAVQGTNSDCIFVGKVMFFDSTLGNIPAYSVAGIRTATDLSGAGPSLMGVNGTETAEDYKMPAGIKLINSAGNSLSATVGLFFDYNSSLSNGAAGVLPYKINANSIQTLATNIKTYNSTNYSKIDTSGIKLCFSSGTNSQKGIINLSKGIDGIATSMTIGDTVSGCWDGGV